MKHLTNLIIVAGIFGCGIKIVHDFFPVEETTEVVSGSKKSQVNNRALEQMPALTARLQGWLDHVRACEASGQTMAEYAKAHGLPLKAFYDGRTRLIKRGVLRGKANGGAFQRVRVVSQVVGPLDCRVHLPNGIWVELGVDERLLGRVRQIAKAL